MPIEKQSVRVLVVEDDVEVAHVIELALKWKGYSVSLAASVAEGLSSLASIRPDVVISDVHLPDGQIASLLARLADIFPRVPVVAMSGFDELGVAEHRSVSLFLQKPVTPSILVETVACLTSQGGAEVVP
jgi:two-component system, NtrC family, response regulator GlrR